MKITPLEIRQKDFEKKLRGYDKDEVNAFLQSLSNEWERILDENKETKIRLDQAEKEVQKLREVENSLFKTLKTAEDTGANLIDQANKAAELHMKETDMQAEALLSESKSKAKGILERAELQAKEMIEEMQEALKDLEKNYRSLENQRDNLLAELKILSSDIMERLDRTNRQNTPFKVEDHMKRVRDMVRESEQRINEQKLDSVDEKMINKIPEINPKDENSLNQLQSFISSKSGNEVEEPLEKVTSEPIKPVEKPPLPEKVRKVKRVQNGINHPVDSAVKKPIPPKASDSSDEEGSFFDSL